MGTDVFTISRLLGHENVGITQIYLRTLADKDLIQQAKSQSVLGSI
jgi:integrase/recombinase XerD